jgi:hypothetical protein
MSEKRDAARQTAAELIVRCLENEGYQRLIARARKLQRLVSVVRRAPYGPGLVVVALAILLGSLFAATYTLALGRPEPREIPTALVVSGGSSADRALIYLIEREVGSSLDLRAYPSEAAARRAIEQQHVYAALIFAPGLKRLMVASAAGASVARVFEQAARSIDVIDIKPLPPSDPNGLDVFYITLAANIVGFITMFQLRANAPGLSLRAWFGFVAGLALLLGFALSLASGPIIGALPGSFLEKWGILTLETLIAGLVSSTMIVLVGRWAIIPAWLLFVVLGNTSSGGAVAWPLLPPFFAFIGRWLPPGATVSALRNAVYFRHDQHAEPLVVLAGWSIAGIAALLLASRWRGRGPSQP